MTHTCLARDLTVCAILCASRALVYIVEQVHVMHPIGSRKIGDYQGKYRVNDAPPGW